MTEESRRTSENEENENPDSAPKRWLKRLSLKRFLTPRWLFAIIVVSVAAHGAVFGFCRASRAIETENSLEITLGQFQFTADKSEESPVAKAGFRLHISLLKDIDAIARRRLEARRFTVQQNIEELLRQAHGGDFADPTLIELKRQLQEKINDTLSLRAIGEVIITDLSVEPAKKRPTPQPP